MNHEDKKLEERITVHQEERDLLMRDCMESVGIDPAVFFEKSYPQSISFMVDLIPVLHKLYFNAPVNVEKTVLDVGPQTYGGTELLDKLHRQETFNNLKLKITSIDIHDKFELVRKIICPNVEFIHSNIFDVTDRSWDTIICSHVIEHVDNPIEFLKKLQSLANDYIIIAAPWNEYPLETGGHINTINKELLQPLAIRDFEIYTNYMWGKRREVCKFVLDGNSSSNC